MIPPGRWTRTRRGRRPGFAAVLLCLLLAHGAAAWAQTATSLTLQRSDAEIELTNQGLAAEGARTVLNVPGCVPDEEVRSSIFYAPEGGVTARITQNDDGSETFVHAPLMSVLRPEGGGDEEGEDTEGGAEDETLEALDAEATFEERPSCLATVEVAESPAVRLEQGRTTVVGGRFFLDRRTDVATMDGPVALTREPDGDGPVVEAEAEGLRFDLDADRSTLTGDVRVVAGDRVSSADELELDEAAGLAILRGSPAVSREGADEVRGSRLLYDLETNDVVVEGGVSVSFEWGDDDAEDASPADETPGDAVDDDAPADVPADETPEAGGGAAGGGAADDDGAGAEGDEAGDEAPADPADGD